MMNYLTPLLLTLLVIGPAFAQDTCPAMVNEALAALDIICEGTNRDELCYGHKNVNVTTFEASVDFDAPGDVMPIVDIETIRTSPLVMPDEWGIALMRVQANVPDTLPGQDVVFLLFGDVKIQNAVSPVTTLSASTGGSINVRSGPSTNTLVRTSLAANTALQLVGRNAAGDWVYFTADEVSGWLFAALLSIEGDITALEIVGDDYAPQTRYSPMQAVYFTSGVGTGACAEAPHDGILIHAPDVGFPIELRINEVDIQIRSTIFLEAQAAALMNVYVLDGQAVVTSQGVRQVVPQGASISIPLNAEGRAAGAPSEPESYLSENVEVLPIQTVDSEGVIAEPATTQAIEAANQPSTIEGTWTGIDADGSHIRVVITPLGDSRYQVDYSDDATTGPENCHGGGISGTAQGTLVNNTLAIEFTGTCADGGGTWGPASVTFTYNPENDTLQETWTDFGITVAHTRQS